MYEWMGCSGPLSIEVEGTVVMFHQAAVNAFAPHSSALMPSDRLGVYSASPPALGIWHSFFFLIRLCHTWIIRHESLYRLMKHNVLFLDNLKNLTVSVLNLKCMPKAIRIVRDLNFLFVSMKPVLQISYSVLFPTRICSAGESLMEIKGEWFCWKMLNWQDVVDGINRAKMLNLPIWNSLFDSRVLIWQNKWSAGQFGDNEVIYLWFFSGMCWHIKEK